MTATANQRFNYENFTPATPGCSAVAEAALKKIDNVVFYINDSLSNQDRQIIVANRLLNLSKDCSIDNWDGYNGIAISQEVLNQTLEFTKSLSPDIPTPDLCPEPDGEIAVEWYGNNNAIISVSVGEKGTLNYAAIFPDKNKANGTESLNGKNKGVIEGHIKRVLS